MGRRRRGGEAAGPTVLERHLADGAPRPVGPVDALVAGRRRFLRGERLDMQELAAELGISRATLYRWVGSRELLLGEIIWSLAQIGIEEARAAATGHGVDRVMQFYECFLHLTAGHIGLRRFVENEQETALRLLTSKEGVQQPRLIDALRAFLEEVAADGELQLRLDAADLAYVMTRIAESFVWREFITGDEMDLVRCAEIVRLLLGCATRPA